MKARLLPWLGSLLVMLAASGCATYRDDLDRAMNHYNNREYERASALLEVLEPDIDSLSKAERLQYAYYRGMSYFLLEQKRHARHWLGRAMARLEDQEDVLRPEDLKQAQDTLGQLNAEVYGDAETPATKGSRGTKSASCKADSECDEGSFCDAGTCRATDGNDGDETPPDADGTKPTGDGASNGAGGGKDGKDGKGEKPAKDEKPTSPAGP